MAFQGAAIQGALHHYSPHLVAFEHGRKTPTDQPLDNLLLWIGGLSDGLQTCAYSTTLAQRLPNGWSLAQPLLSSSYNGWGKASLDSDVKELTECVEYFRKIKTGKIVLMGLSTGCQDVMKFLNTPTTPQIQGAILQSGASDRQALLMLQGPERYQKGVETAQAMAERGEGEQYLPGFLTTGLPPAPVTARRWLSLASPNHDGDDDMFSSDLTDERLQLIFGNLPAQTPLCILFSGSDQFVPEFVDKQALLKRWTAAVKAGSGTIDEEYSAVVKGATHTYEGSPPEVLEDLFTRVTGFLSKL